MGTTDKLSVSGTTAGADDSFTFTNNRTANVPTSFITTYGPYVAGLAVLGGLGYAMLRKKKTAE